MVIVAEFELQSDDYTAFYHDELDVWEVSGPDEFYKVCSPGDPFYQFCESTVDQFRDSLLAGPGGNRLSRKLAREISREMDAEILRDLKIAAGCSSPPPIPQITMPAKLPNYKMKATWSLEAEQDLRATLEAGKDFIGKSRLAIKG